MYTIINRMYVIISYGPSETEVMTCQLCKKTDKYAYTCKFTRSVYHHQEGVAVSHTEETGDRLFV